MEEAPGAEEEQFLIAPPRGFGETLFNKNSLAHLADDVAALPAI